MIGMVYFVVALQYTVKQEELARKKKNTSNQLVNVKKALHHLK